MTTLSKENSLLKQLYTGTHQVSNKWTIPFTFRSHRVFGKGARPNHVVCSTLIGLTPLPPGSDLKDCGYKPHFTAGDGLKWVLLVFDTFVSMHRR